MQETIENLHKMGLESASLNISLARVNLAQAQKAVKDIQDQIFGAMHPGVTGPFPGGPTKPLPIDFTNVTKLRHEEQILQEQSVSAAAALKKLQDEMDGIKKHAKPASESMHDFSANIFDAFKVVGMQNPEEISRKILELGAAQGFWQDMLKSGEVDIVQYTEAIVTLKNQYMDLMGITTRFREAGLVDPFENTIGSLRQASFEVEVFTKHLETYVRLASTAGEVVGEAFSGHFQIARALSQILGFLSAFAVTKYSSPKVR